MGNNLELQEKVEEVKANGFAVFPNFFKNRYLLSRALAELEELLDRDLEANRNLIEQRGEFSSPKSFYSREQHNIFFPSAESPALQELATEIFRSDDLRPFLERVVGKTFRIRMDIVRRLTGVLDKVDDFNLPHQWHIDTKGEFAFVIFLQDCDRIGSGQTAVLPGTHWANFDPLWKLIFDPQRVYISRKVYLAASGLFTGYLRLHRLQEKNIIYMPPRIANLGFVNRFICKYLQNRKSSVRGKAGDLGFFFNSTWHGRDHNTSGEKNILVRIGGFPSDFKFLDNVPLPEGFDQKVSPGVWERYKVQTEINEDSSTIVNQIYKKPLSATISGLPRFVFTVASVEREVLAKISILYYFSVFGGRYARIRLGEFGARALRFAGRIAKRFLLPQT